MRTPAPIVVMEAADALADAVKEWEDHGSMNNCEKLKQARERYERVRNRPTKGFEPFLGM